VEGAGHAAAPRRQFILAVMKSHPDLFSDLAPIPADVAITPGFVFKP
jgi:sulfonate transport system substrate-binding protein